MLSWKVAIILTLMFSLGSQMQRKHYLIETEGEDDAEEGEIFACVYFFIFIMSFTSESV